MRKSLIAASLLAVTVAMAPACATKKYVRTEVGDVNSKVAYPEKILLTPLSSQFCCNDSG